MPSAYGKYRKLTKTTENNRKLTENYRNQLKIFQETTYIMICKTYVCTNCLFSLSVLSVTLMCCGQTTGLIKMQLGTEVGLGPGHIVLDGDPSPPLKWTQPVSPIFGPYVVAKWLDGSRCYLVGR